MSNPNKNNAEENEHGSKATSTVVGGGVSNHGQKKEKAPRVGGARGRKPAARLRAHEFHHSSLEKVDPGARFAYRVVRGHGIYGAEAADICQTVWLRL